MISIPAGNHRHHRSCRCSTRILQYGSGRYCKTTYWITRSPIGRSSLKITWRSWRSPSTVQPAQQSFRGARQSIVFPENLTAAIKQLSRRESVTLFTTLLAAFKTLLYRYSGQEEVVIGSPIAGRNRTEIENLIGLFANTLVLRTEFLKTPASETC